MMAMALRNSCRRVSLKYFVPLPDSCGAVVSLLALSVGAVLVGCTLAGPDYQPPPRDAPATWRGAATTPPSWTADDEARLAQWWRNFDDPLLADLIARAVTGNRDLRQAEARVREARARRGLASANRFPTLALGGSANRSRVGARNGVGGVSELYALGFDASWELDLFGGQRRALEAADARVQSSEADVGDVLVSLAAETALNYLELRAGQARLQVAEASLVTERESYDLARWREAAGLATRLDVEQAATSLAQTESRLPTLRSGVEQAGNRLAVLLGSEPGAVADMVANQRPIPHSANALVVGIPAQTLQRRPDVRRAERELAAQTAQVGVATAAQWPNLALIGSIGLESLASSTLLQASSRTFNVGGSGAWTLFDAGRVRSGIDIETAVQEQALEQYEATVLIALQEVEDALVAYAGERSRQAALASANVSATRALALARDQYAAGLTDFQAVLETQRSLQAVQDQLASSTAEVSSNLVRLYKALGGGWLAESAVASVSPPSAPGASGQPPKPASVRPASAAMEAPP